MESPEYVQPIGERRSRMLATVLMSWLAVAGIVPAATAESGFARQFRCGIGFVIPAKAGIQKQCDEYTVWMPAFAGMTLAGGSGIELSGKAAESSALPPAAPPIRLLATIPLENVSGRIDHLAVDLQGKRLFVAALGNGTVEVIDLRVGKRTHTLTGLHEPQGLVFAPDVGRLFVAEGEGGAVRIFDAASLQLITAVHFSDDADNLRYDSAGKRLYVGYGNGALGVVDAKHGTRVGEVKLAGHPESFQLETSGTRIFVNIPAAHQIDVVDRRGGTVVGAWRLTTAGANFPMALDEGHHRLLVGCRDPAKLIVYDTASGSVVAELNDVGRDADDIFYDAARQRFYLSAGEGFVDVIAQKDPDHYALLARVPTVPGARTSLFVPELHRLYVAVRQRGDQPAAIWVYGTE